MRFVVGAVFAVYALQLSAARSRCCSQCVGGTQPQLYTPTRRQVGACAQSATTLPEGRARTQQRTRLLVLCRRLSVRATAQTTCTNVSHCRSCACATRRRPRGHLDGQKEAPMGVETRGASAITAAPLGTNTSCCSYSCCASYMMFRSEGRRERVRGRGGGGATCFFQYGGASLRVHKQRK